MQGRRRLQKVAHRRADWRGGRPGCSFRSAALPGVLPGPGLTPPWLPDQGTGRWNLRLRMLRIEATPVCQRADAQECLTLGKDPFFGTFMTWQGW